jgi:hypothetical protein
MPPVEHYFILQLYQVFDCIILVVSSAYTLRGKKKTKKGNAKLVESLIQKQSIDINSTDNNGLSLLEYAAYRGNVDVCRAILRQQNVNVEHRDNFGMAAIHKAVGFGHYPVVKLLIEEGKADPDARQGDTTAPASFEATTFYDRPLHLAARRGDAPMIKLLCSAKANPNLRNGGGETPLHIACRRAPSVFQSTRLLLSARQSLLERLGVVDRDSRIKSAGECSSWGSIAALLECGADATLPLTEATWSPSLNNAEARGTPGATPLQLAPVSVRLAHATGQLANVAYLRRCLGNE